MVRRISIRVDEGEGYDFASKSVANSLRGCEIQIFREACVV